MKINFVNHASILIENKNVNLILDPWIEGDAFYNGWMLLSKSKFQIKDFENVTHIWFSHEHPDHFSPFVLNKIPKEIKAKITVLYHHTIDKKVIQYCEKIGFKNVIELKDDEKFELEDGFTILNNEYADGDSWCYIEVDNFTILNVNDCIIRSEEEALIVKEKIGEVDLLMTQFGYAHKIGNVEDDNLRIQSMNSKLERITNQSKIFNPKYILPFASFVFFCHEENKYMNLKEFRLNNVINHILNIANKNPILMYPGDIWDPKSNFYNCNEIVLKKYEQDFLRLEKFEFLKSKKIEESEIINNSIEFGKLLVAKNKTAKRLINKIGTVFYISDYDASYRFLGSKGLKKIKLEKEFADIIISSDMLLYIFKNLWGAGTCQINARYLTTSKGDVYKFHLLMRITALNNEGKEFYWRKPSLLSRLNKIIRVK